MGRRPQSLDGAEDRAIEVVKSTTDANLLRAAQAALMPLLGWSLDDTARVVGRDRWWVSRNRNRFLREEPLLGHGGRRRSMLSTEDEVALVKQAIWQPGVGLWRRKTVRRKLRDLLDARSATGAVADSTVSEMMDRVAPLIVRGAKGRDLEGVAESLAKIWALEARRAAPKR